MPGELEVPRRIAANLLLEGMTIREVARLVEASASSVKRWKDALDAEGRSALAAKVHPSREPSLTTRQRRTLLHLLEEGAIAAGYDTGKMDMSARVAELIETRFGVLQSIRFLLNRPKCFRLGRTLPVGISTRGFNVS
jgi:transposase